MHDLYALKEKLVKELEEYGRSDDMSKSTLDIVDKLAHACKNVAKVIECCDEEYSKEGRSYRDPSTDYVRPDGSYRDMSYRGRGRNANRDSMGRYSRDEGIDEHTKEELRKLIERM